MERVYARERHDGRVLADAQCSSAAPERRLPAPDAALRPGETVASRLAVEHGIPRVDASTLSSWLDAKDRETTYVIDVRPLENTRKAVPGSGKCVTGGQACQRTTTSSRCGARIVMVDGTRRARSSPRTGTNAWASAT